MIERMNPNFIHAFVGYTGGRVTVAWLPRLEQEECITIRYGLAWCSPRDQFVRAKGRMISRGRMEKYDNFLRVDRLPCPNDSIFRLSHTEVLQAIQNFSLINRPLWAHEEDLLFPARKHD